MSEVPCQSCRHTDRGRLFYGYLTTFVGDDTLKFRLRLCGDCWADLVPPVTEFSDRKDGDSWIPIDQLPATSGAAPSSKSPSPSIARAARKR